MTLAAKIMRKKVIFHIHETSIQKSLKYFLRFVIRITASGLYMFQNTCTNEKFKSINSNIIYNSLSKSFEIEAGKHKYQHNKSPFLVFNDFAL